MKGWDTFILVSMLWLIFSPMFKDVVANTPTGNLGFISIDCGVEEDYVDAETGISYKSDKDFISTGENHDVPAGLTASSSLVKTVSKNLRSFPNGRKNCYSLRPEQGKNHNYYIRAFFNYGNYDGMNQPPRFDIYIGVNRWVTIEGLNTTHWTAWDLFHFSLTDTILVCLVNNNSGVPFISALELRPLNDSIYKSDSGSLTVHRRYKPSNSSRVIFRYNDDAFDRFWQTYQLADTIWANPTSDLEFNKTDDPYKLPIEVLRSAVQPNTSNSLSYRCFCSLWEPYVYFHFAETVNIPKGQHKELTITLNGHNYGPFTLEYLKPLTVPLKSPTQGDIFFTINSTKNSDLPPILNAFEILNALHLPDAPTDKADVDAIMAIKQLYNIKEDDWQGDPCVPRQLSWNGLNCSHDNTPPNIISLDLSSRTLTGDIASALSNLKALQSLDLSNNKLSGTVWDFLAELQNLTTLNLSYNELTGQVPEFLAEMPNLVTLNLSGNRFTGSIPPSLLEKSDNGILKLSFDKNPDLCQTNSCEKKHFLFPIVASIASVLVLLLLSIITIFWRNRRRQELQTSKDRSFSYLEIVSITNNFTTIIGGGGFGKVYLGTLKDGTEVAIKLLSPSSKQGCKEFQAEVQLLLIVHHRNLVSLIGYCNDHHNMALIYEYMAGGNLHENLTETSGSTLTWKERLQIAVDAAYGLEYLHNGCKPPIIHRDLKTSNILLNEKLQAKISDFGLSRAFKNESGSHITTCPAGTFGYMDPEAQASGNFNKKSDVYSFGIILFELITGRTATIRNVDGNLIFIHQWVKPIIDRGDIQNVIDPRLQGEFDTNSAWKVVEIAMSCVPNSAICRPDMSQVLVELQECLATSMPVGRNSLEMSYLEPDTDMNPSAR